MVRTRKSATDRTGEIFIIKMVLNCILLCDLFRFDLTDITASNDNRSFVISLNHVGETVLKVGAADEMLDMVCHSLRK